MLTLFAERIHAKDKASIKIIIDYLNDPTSFAKLNLKCHIIVIPMYIEKYFKVYHFSKLHT